MTRDDPNWNREGTTQSGEPAAHISRVRFTPPKPAAETAKPDTSTDDNQDTSEK